jgi:hypothetical protein
MKALQKLWEHILEWNIYSSLNVKRKKEKLCLHISDELPRKLVKFFSISSFCLRSDLTSSSVRRLMTGFVARETSFSLASSCPTTVFSFCSNADILLNVSGSQLDETASEGGEDKRGVGVEEGVGAGVMAGVTAGVETGAGVGV